MTVEDTDTNAQLGDYFTETILVHHADYERMPVITKVTMQ
mgnify:FL=1